MIKRPLSDSPLTAEERVFAEAHHDLMYRYMRIHDLDIEEWYDRLIIAYLNSVKKYLRYEKLQSLKFEQVFFRTLDNARSNYWRDLNRYKRCPEGGIWSIEGMEAINNNEAEADDCDFYNLLKDDRISLNDIVIDSLYTSALIDELEKEQYKKIVLLLIEGYSGEEIRNMLHIGYKKYSRYIAEIKDVILMCIG